jgi:putative phosphoesterase
MAALREKFGVTGAIESGTNVTIAVISDIHGNLPALEAVLGDLSKRPHDRTYCLGDLVGYGAFPNEVVDRIRTEGVPTIMGNYDDGVGFDRDDCGCAYRDEGEKARGQESLLWTRANTRDENKELLRGLVSQIRFEAEGRRVLLVHGSPRRMNEYLFEDRPDSSFQRLAASSDADIIVFGHTHKPYVKEIDGVLFVNAGSVGKPKDGDWRACYVLLTPGAAEPVEFVRVPYDLDRITQAMAQTTLPSEFSEDLKTGGRGAAAG